MSKNEKQLQEKNVEKNVLNLFAAFLEQKNLLLNVR